VEFYIYQFLPIVLIEFVVLWKMKWGSFGVTLLDTLIVNFASFVGLLLGLGPYITTSGILGLTLFGTYSVIVEGAVLMLLERHGAKKVWICTLTANFFSCAMLGCESLYMAMHAPVAVLK
jgi:hypothetical protein